MKFVFLATLLMASIGFGHPGHHPPHHPPQSGGLFLSELQFWPTGPGCFLRAHPNSLPAFTWNVVNSGGVPVFTTQGIRILTAYDPIQLNPYLYRLRRDDMIVSSPSGILLYPRYGFVPYGYIEVFQTPRDARVCR